MKGRFLLSGFLLVFALQTADAKNTPAKGQKNSQIATQGQPGPKKLKVPSKFNNAACSAYLDRLRSKIDNNWYLPDGTNHVVIKATVGQNGSVDNVEISSNPKNDTAEQAANEAFLKAQPLELLPSGSGEQVKLVLDLESYADPHGDSRRTISSRIEEVKGTPSQKSAEDTANSNKKE